MLRIIQSTGVDRAKSYFSSADYYLQGQEQELVGSWRGEGARLRQPIERIGVEAVLHPSQGFDQRLVANRVADAKAGEGTRFR